MKSFLKGFGLMAAILAALGAVAAAAFGVARLLVQANWSVEAATMVVLIGALCLVGCVVFGLLSWAEGF